MSINIGDKPEFNVVNVGDELTQDQLAALQNAQGASATNPCLTRTNTFDTSDTAVLITQLGTGAAFRVEDSTSPDATPFIITATGNVGIGTASAGNALSVVGRSSINSTSGAGGDPVLTVLNSGGGNVPALNVQVTASTASASNVALFTNHANATADCVRITNLGTGNSFVVEDDTNPDSTPFVITATGNVGVGTSNPSGKFQTVGGSVLFSNGSAGGNGFFFTTTTTGAGFSFSNGATNSSELIGATAIGTGSIAVFTNTATATADAVRITNLGSGNSFVVEDSTNPDSSPFVINNDGSVGIGTNTPSTKLAVIGSASFTGATSVSTSGANALTVSVTNTSSAVIGSLIDYRGTGNAFRIVNSTTETFNIAGSGAVTLTNYLTLHAGALATSVGSQTYPDELEFKVGSTTYRVPARAI